MKLKRSTYGVLQIQNISLVDKTDMKELFNKMIKTDSALIILIYLIFNSSLIFMGQMKLSNNSSIEKTIHYEHPLCIGKGFGD